MCHFFGLCIMRVHLKYSLENIAQVFYPLFFLLSFFVSLWCLFCQLVQASSKRLLWSIIIVLCRRLYGNFIKQWVSFFLHHGKVEGKFKFNCLNDRVTGVLTYSWFLTNFILWVFCGWHTSVRNSFHLGFLGGCLIALVNIMILQ